MADVPQAVERADTFVMALCKPTEMSRAEARDYLETLVERFEMSLEAMDEDQQQADSGDTADRGGEAKE